MKRLFKHRATPITWLLILLPPLILLAPALRPGYTMLPAHLPFVVDPIWQPLAPPNVLAEANPVLSDQFYQYHAWQTAHRQSLAQGELAWWTTGVNGGQPLLGNGQVGLLDPFHLVGMLFPLTASYVVGALLRLWVAGTFTYLYARTIGLSHAGAWLSLISFTCSGLIVHWLGATPSHVLVWLPALLWVGEKVLITRCLIWSLAAAIALAVLIFSSQPEIAFQVAIAWGVYVLIRAAWLEGGSWRGLQDHALRWLWIALLGLSLAAIEVLPFVDTVRQSVVFQHRAAPSTHASTWLQEILLSWQAIPTIVTVLLPNFLGREQDESYWFPTGNSIENNAYAGVLPLLLAILALWAAWRNQEITARRWLWLWGAMGVGALLLALEFPLVTALNHLPPFNLIEAGRWRGIYIFAVAILAGFGLDALLDHNSLRRVLWMLLIGAMATNLLLVGVAYAGFSFFSDQLIAYGRAFMEANAGSPMLDRPLDELYALVETRQQAKLAMLRLSNPIMVLPLWVALLSMLLLWQAQRQRISHRWLAHAFVAITALDLLWVSAGVNAAAPIQWLEWRPPAVTYLQEQPQPFRVVGTHLILNPNMSMLAQLEDVRGYDPLVSNRYRSLLGGLDGFAPSGYHNYFRHLDDPRLDLFNATYGLSRTPPTSVRWQALFQDPSGVTVYRSESALPRAYLVYAADVVENAEQSLARTLDPNFDPRRSVVLEQTPVGFTPPAEPPGENAPITFRQRRATHVELTVESPVQALLVLLDTYNSGWRATVDQQPTPVYAANHAFRAIVVPAGNHTVIFTYAPPSVTLGIAISAGASIVVAVLLLWLWVAKQTGRHA